MSAIKRTLCLLLALVMVLGAAPLQVFAAELEGQPADQAEEISDTPEIASDGTEAAVETTAETLPAETEETAKPQETAAATEEPGTEPQETVAEETEEIPEETEATEATEAEEEARETLPPMYFRCEEYGFDYSEKPFPEKESGETTIQATASATIPTISKVEFDGHESSKGPGEVRIHLSKPNAAFKGDIVLGLYNADTDEELYWTTGVNYDFGQSVIALPWLQLDLGQGYFDSGKYYVEVFLDSGTSRGMLVRSNTITFKKPQSLLASPKNSSWKPDPYNANELVAGWDVVSAAAGYHVQWNSAGGGMAGSYHINGPTDTIMYLPVENSGQTRFRVQALANLNYSLHSEFSGWSAYAYGKNGVVIPKDDISAESVDKFETIHYLALSALAYDDWKTGDRVYDKVANKWKGKLWGDNPSITGKSLYGELADWKVVATSTDWRNDLDGFYAVAFRGMTSAGEKTVVAYRGSINPLTMDFSAKDIKDLVNDWLINDAPFHLKHVHTAQLQYARDFYSYCLKKLKMKPADLDVTGHSLGGALASVVVMTQADTKGEIFNAANGFEAMYKHKLSEVAPYFKGMDQWKLIDHVVLTDSLVGAYRDEYWNLPSITYKYSGTKTNLGLFDSHGLHSFLKLDSATGKAVMNYKGTASKASWYWQPDDLDIFLGTSKADKWIASGSPVDFSTGTNYNVYCGGGKDDITITGLSADNFVCGPGNPIIDGGAGDDCYYYYKGDGVMNIKDSSGNDVIYLNGFDRGDTVVFERWEGWGELSYNGKAIAYIDLNHSLLGSMKVVMNNGNEIKIDGFQWKALKRQTLVACPVDVEILDSEGNVVLTLRDGTEETRYEDFGNFYVYNDQNGENVKYLELIDGYDFRIVGVGDGTMDIVHSENEGEQNVLTDAPVSTGMTAIVTENDNPILAMDNDSDGTYDAAYPMAGDLTEQDVKLDQEYLIVQKGSSVQLTVSTDYEVLRDLFTFDAVPAEEGNEPVISVDKKGNVTALEVGTAYAVMTFEAGGKTYTSRCRIDVTSDGTPIEEQVTDLTLSTNALTVELFKNDYSVLRIFEDLPQNSMAMGLTPRPTVENNGVAVTSAKLTDAAAASVFDLVVKDDGSIYVVPKDSALQNPTTVAASYTSPVVVTVGTREFNPGTVKLTVKKTLPKLKAKDLTFNTFFSGQTLPVEITGGEVFALSAVSVPEWLELTEGGTLQLTAAAVGKHSGKVMLEAAVTGYGVTVPVTVSAKASRVQPKLALARTSVILYNRAEGSQGYPMQLVSKTRNVTLSDMQVSGIQAPDGYRVEDFSPETGSFLLIPEQDPVAGAINLAVAFENTDAVIPLKLTVKTADVTLKASSTKVTLNPAVAAVTKITLTPDRPDYRMEEPEIVVTNAPTGEEIMQGYDLDWEYEDGILTIKTTYNTWYDSIYKVTVAPYEGGKQTVITVKTSPWKNHEIKLTTKATGAVDTAIPGSECVVELRYKNYEPYGNESFAYRITAAPALQDGTNAADLFDVTVGGDQTLHIRQAEGKILDASRKYSITVNAMIDDTIGANSKTIPLPVKQSALKVKLAKTSVVLNGQLRDEVAAGITSGTKGYTLTEPVFRVLDSAGSETDALQLAYEGGVLKIASCENTMRGNYKVMVAAAQGSKESVLKVKAAGVAEVKSTIKVSGKMDVLRPDAAAARVAYTLANYNALQQGSYGLEIVDAAGNDCTGCFRVEEQGSGSFQIFPGEGANSAMKYRVRLAASLPQAGAEGDKEIYSPYAALKVTMGKAAVKADKTQLTLHADDRYSTEVLHLSCSGYDLAGIAEVRIRDAAGSNAFRLENLGGDNYAIGFAPNMGVPAKPVKLTLDIILKGNLTGQANASVTVTVKTVK